MFTTQHGRQAVRATDPAQDPILPRLQDPPCEAPDRGEFQPEAPEAAVARYAEAPDAGEGRAGLLEHEYTHGRSMS